MPPADGPVRASVSARNALAAALRERVLTGRLVAGARLTELGVAAEFGVARPTARAAFDELTAARLLRHEANRGAFVPILDDAEIHDLFRARGLLEVGAIRELARRTDVPPAARAALADLTVASTRVESDLAFHRTLVAAISCARADLLFDQLADEIRLAIVQCRHANETPESLVAEHAAILDAIAAGDADRAEAAFHHHLDETVRVLTVVSR